MFVYMDTWISAWSSVRCAETESAAGIHCRTAAADLFTVSLQFCKAKLSFALPVSLPRDEAAKVGTIPASRFLAYQMHGNMVAALQNHVLQCCSLHASSLGFRRLVNGLLCQRIPASRPCRSSEKVELIYFV